MRHVAKMYQFWIVSYFDAVEHAECQLILNSKTIRASELVISRPPASAE